MNKRKALIGLIIAVIIVAGLYALVFIRPILPGRYVEIVYPGSGYEVPPEFWVVGAGTSWSAGIQVEHPFGSPTVYNTLSGSAATMAVDGKPYASTSGGNHHVFFLKLPAGPHTLRLLTLYGEDEITVEVKNDVPLRFEAFDDEARYIERVDRLREALSEYVRSSSGPIGTDIQNRYYRIYITDTGAFLFFSTRNDRRITACEVRYVDLGGRPVTAGDIGSAPTLFSWDENVWENRVLISGADCCGDRLLFFFVDTDSLWFFYIHPDGSVVINSNPLSAVSPDFAKAIAGTPYIEAVESCGINYAVFRVYASDRFYRFALRDGVLSPMTEDFSATEALFLENGDMIKGNGLYPAYEPFESLFSGRDKWAFVFPPVPAQRPAYSFTGGRVTASTPGFFPDFPRYIVHPSVPGAGYEAEPDYQDMGGAVCFPQGIIECVMGDCHAYFRVTPSGVGNPRE
jgi:hypothetical protein